MGGIISKLYKKRARKRNVLEEKFTVHGVLQAAGSDDAFTEVGKKL